MNTTQISNDNLIKEKAKESTLVLNNIQMFSKYKCLSQESIYNNLDEAKVQSNQSGNDNESSSFGNFGKKIISLSFPTIFFYLILHLQQTICLAFLGKKSKDRFVINGYGIISLYLTCTISCVLTGIVSGLDTLLPNAWSNRNIRLFNIYIQRARLLSVSIGIVIGVINYFTAISILSIFTPSDNSLTQAKIYLVPAMITAILDSQFGINFTILAVINKIKETLICLFLDILLHVFWCYVYIDYYNMGIFGAGMAMIVSQLTNFVTSSFIIYNYNKTQKIQRRHSNPGELTDINSNSSCFQIEVVIKVNKEILKGLKSYFYFIL